MTTLLESRARPYGSKKGAVLSVALHGALIAGAVVASGNAMLPDREKVEEHSILYVAPPPPKVHVAPPPLPEVKRPPPKAPSRAPTPPRMRAPTPPPPTPRPAQPQPAPMPTAPLVAPVSVPVSIPKVDLNALPTTTDVPIPEPARVTAGSDEAGRKAKSSNDGDVEGAGGKKGGLGSGDAGKTYTENQVEETVVPTRPAVPRYPESLRSVNVTGEVIAQYVVDQKGRVEPGSIKILSSSHKLFADAVRAALLESRFRAARVGGNPVRQLVEQPFVFKLQ